MTPEPSTNYLVHEPKQSAIGDNATVNVYNTPVELKQNPYCVTHVLNQEHLIGRSAQLRDLQLSLLQGHRPVLKYLAGVGKTTLALQLAYDKDFFIQFEGVLWADLGAKPQWEAILRRWYNALVNDPTRAPSLKSEQDWYDVVGNLIGSRRMLMILDDVWQCQDARKLMQLGKRCAYLVTTRIPQLANELSDIHSRRFDVQKLDYIESWDMLCQLAPMAAEWFPQETRAIADLADGMPLALLLLGKRLGKESTGDYERLQKTVKKLLDPGVMMDMPAEQDDGENATLSAVIGKSLLVLSSDAARKAFYALSILQPDPHSFDKETAQACGVDEELLYELNDAGLIECHSRSRYAMHRIFAEFGRRRIDPEERRTLHLAAAEHFAEQLSTAGDSPDYLSWYRYEQSDWRDLVDDWLYHLAQAGDSEHAFMSLLRVFFDAFWWWGYYLRYDYCDNLVNIWRARNIAPEIGPRLALLDAFLDAYPAGYEKRGAGDWAAVTQTLESIRALCDASPEHDSVDARQVRGFTNFFLAEALAYGGGNAQAAVQAYRDAIDYFSASDHLWVSCWIEFYLAQFLWEGGDAAAARTHVQRSLALEHEDEPVWERDPEVLANDYRLLAELDLAVGDLAATAHHARRAVFYAWLFQGVPEAADDYTRMFYTEVTSRIARTWSDYARDHRAAVLGLARELYDFLLPARADETQPSFDRVEQALDQGDAAALAAALFPVFPDQEAAGSALECQRRVCAYKNSLIDALT